MIRCYVEDCPTDICSKTCGAPLKQEMQVCDQLYAETGMTEIGYTLCINKVFVSFQLKFVFLQIFIILVEHDRLRRTMLLRPERGRWYL